MSTRRQAAAGVESRRGIYGKVGRGPPALLGWEGKAQCRSLRRQVNSAPKMSFFSFEIECEIEIAYLYRGIGRTSPWLAAINMDS